jgi:hypothetical protein
MGLVALASTLPAEMAPTLACSVDWTNMVPNPAKDDPRKVMTLLIPVTWEIFLCCFNLWHQFNDVPTDLTHGFRIGTSHYLSSTSIPLNHKSSVENAKYVSAAIQKESHKGCYLGLFTPKALEELIGPF